jgi:hypothetical protein
MSQTTIASERSDQDLLCDNVSDEVLEQAGLNFHPKAGAYTVPSAIICIPLAPGSAV